MHRPFFSQVMKTQCEKVRGNMNGYSNGSHSTGMSEMIYDKMGLLAPRRSS